MPTTRPCRSSMVLICGLLVELEVRVREESHLLAPGRDRRARNDGVVASISQAIEDPIEIVASVLYLVPSQTEIFADQAHEFDIEAGLCTVDSNLERWIGESQSTRSTPGSSVSSVTFVLRWPHASSCSEQCPTSLRGLDATFESLNSLSPGRCRWAWHSPSFPWQLSISGTSARGTISTGHAPLSWLC